MYNSYQFLQETNFQIFRKKENHLFRATFGNHFSLLINRRLLYAVLPNRIGECGVLDARLIRHGPWTVLPGATGECGTMDIAVSHHLRIVLPG